jgi:DNA-binding FadR family transcriptional regulator
VAKVPRPRRDAGSSSFEGPTLERAPSVSLGDTLTTAAIERPRASDQVFEALATAIFAGKLPVAGPLPSERQLSEHFNVSRVILREAVHRLRECGLVRVRQGGQTVVLDPEQASDLRVTMLMIELGAATPELEREIAERLVLHFTTVLELGEARATTSEIDGLERQVELYTGAQPDDATGFLGRFWIAAAGAGRNRIVQRETRWWFGLCERRPALLAPLLGTSREARLALHRALVEKLRRRERAAAHFLATMRAAVGL